MGVKCPGCKQPTKAGERVEQADGDNLPAQELLCCGGAGSLLSEMVIQVQDMSRVSLQQQDALRGWNSSSTM